MTDTNLILIKEIERSIYLIRGEKVMLDRDLAKLYEVSEIGLFVFTLLLILVGALAAIWGTVRLPT